MKKNKFILMLCVLTFMLTGCVKYNANMTINKDKSMDFSIIYALDTSLFEDQELLSDEDKQKLESQGFTITDYSEGTMKGYTLTKKISNIDYVSTTSNASYDLSGLLDSNATNSYIFKVTKGLLKNTYTANFAFDASESDINSDSTDTTDNLNDLFSNDEEEETILSEEKQEETDQEETNLDGNMDFSDMDLSSLTSNLDLSFNVNLPYSAKSNNATTTSDNNKKLSWNLSSTEISTIEFTFELYNMTNVYIGIGLLVILIAAIVVLIVSKKKNSSDKNSNLSSETVEKQNNIANQQDNLMGNPFQPVNPNLPYQQMPTPEVINSTNNFGNTIPGQVNQMTNGMPQTIGSSPSQMPSVNQSIPGATFNQVNSESSIDTINQQVSTSQMEQPMQVSEVNSSPLINSINQGMPTTQIQAPQAIPNYQEPIQPVNQQPILNQNINQVDPINISSLPQDNQGI